MTGRRKGEAAETYLDGRMDGVRGSQKGGGEGGTCEVSGWTVVSLAPLESGGRSYFGDMSTSAFPGAYV